MCKTCDDKLSKFGPTDEDRVDPLGEVLSAAYDAGVDAIRQSEDNPKVGNGGMAVFIDQLISSKETATFDIITRMSGDPKGMADELILLERESIVIALVAGAKLHEAEYPVELWQCEDMDETFPCGHTAEDHRKISKASQN